MIIIAGDSWGAGEWNNAKVQHQGLAQYLHEDGHQVINLSRPAGSNYDTWNRLENFLLCNPWADIEKIFVFQTEWERELLLNVTEVLPEVSAAKILNSVGIVYIDPDKSLAEQIDLQTANSLGTMLILNFYQQLSRLAEQYQVKFEIIGGCTDAMNTNISNVHVVCQSFANLLINDHDRVEHPVYTFYKHTTVLDFVKNNLHSAEQLKELLWHVENAEQRLNMFAMHPEWFYPDGVHANRAGHLKLYDFLKQNW